MALLLAVLALLSQVVIGSLVLPTESAAAAPSRLDAMMVMCGGGPPSGSQHGPRHRPDMPPCPIAASLDLPPALPTPIILLPVPVLHGTGGPIQLPASRAPPSAFPRLQQARGPPILT